MWGRKLVGEIRGKGCQLCNYIIDNILGRIQPFPVSASGQKTFGNEKNYQPVSRILFPRWCGRSSFIWPRHCCRDLAAYPPAQPSCEGIGRAALDHRYTWHFSMQGLPAPAVTCLGRRLLPYVFILTPRGPVAGMRRGSYFLWHFLLALARHPALNRYIALCCPDFPPLAERGAMTRLVATAKVRTYRKLSASR